MDTDQSLLQEDLDSVVRWSNEWLIQLNSLKCTNICFSLVARKRSANYHVNGELLVQTSSYKDLGIEVTDNFSWSSHIEHICSRAYNSLHVIKRNVPSLPSSSSIGLKRATLLVLSTILFLVWLSVMASTLTKRHQRL